MRITRTICCIVATALGLLAGSAYGATVPLPVSYDSHIDGNNPTNNYGANLSLSVGHTAAGGQKPYLLFDASAFGTMTNVVRVESLKIWWGSSLTVTKSLGIYLMTGTNSNTGTGANDWLETTICWTNAPGNNVVPPSRDFAAYPGETITNLGTIQYLTGNPRELNFLLAEGSTQEAALLTALNTGDRKATIAIRFNSSSETTVRSIYSSERDGGIYTPTLQVGLGAPPATPVSFVREPVSVTLTNGPYKNATFITEVYGSAPITYQWFTNSVPVDGATNTTLALPVETTNLNGTLVSVRIDNDYTADPGIVSSNALLTIVEAPIPDGIIRADADVYYQGNAIFNSAMNGTLPCGLTASGGLGLEQVNRSYIGFTLGTQHVSSAVLRLFQVWGGTDLGTQFRYPQATIGIWGSTNELTLPAIPTGQWDVTVNPEYAAPDNTNFMAALPAQVVGPERGWYDWDITDYYNANLGLQSVIRVAGLTTSGYDPVLFEDSENTAYTVLPGGTLLDSGPRIEYILGPPWIQNVNVVGGQLVMTGSAPRNPSDTFYVLASPNVGAPLNTWTSIATNQFDANGNFSVSIPIESSVSQRFYLLQVP